MNRLLTQLVFLFLIVLIGCYAAGWLTFNRGATSTTIEIKTDEIKQAKDKAIERGKEIVDEIAHPKTATPEKELPPTTPVPSTP